MQEDDEIQLFYHETAFLKENMLALLVKHCSSRSILKDGSIQFKAVPPGFCPEGLPFHSCQGFQIQLEPDAALTLQSPK